MEVANKTLFPNPFNPYLDEVRKPTYRAGTEEILVNNFEKASKQFSDTEKFLNKISTNIVNMNSEFRSNKNRSVGTEINREYEAISRIKSYRKVNSFDAGKLLNISA